MAKNVPLLNKINKIFGLIWNHKKISLLTIIIILGLGYLFIPKNKTVIATQKVTQKDLKQTVSITGKIESENTANLTFQSPETLAYVPVALGQEVKKGQLIATIDQQKLQASLRQAQQDFVAAKAASQQYYNNHTNATESDSEKVQRTVIDAAQNKAYDQILKVQHDLANSALYSPINGIVTRLDAKTPGVNINSTTVFGITDPQTLEFSMDVDEADIGKIKIGQEVNVNLDSYPNENLNLAVDSIDFITHTTSTGGNAYTVKAKITADNLDFKYKIGMNGNADIVLDKVSNVLTIPLSSVFDNNKVYVKNGNKFVKATVELGLQNDIEAEVISGLSVNQEVVLDPTQIK